MGFCDDCGKAVLVIINALFALLGLGLLIPGVLLAVKVAAITNEIKPVLDTLTVNGVALGTATQNLSIVLIVLGAFVFLIAFIGLLGACKKSPCLLVLYAVIVGILFISKVTAIILWFTMHSEFEAWMRTQLQKKLNETYKKDTISGDSQISNAWNYMFITLECCGVNPVPVGSAGDFAGSYWKRSGEAASQKIPTSCCKDATIDKYTASTRCKDNVEKGLYWEKGCVDVLLTKIFSEEYNTPILAVGILILLIEIVAVTLSCCLCRQEK